MSLNDALQTAQTLSLQVNACVEALQRTSNALASMEKQQALQEETYLCAQTQAAQLRKLSADLHRTQQHAARLADELTARIQDVHRSVRRKWYLPNPPSNTLIDHAESGKEHFARGLNLYKLMLILFIGSFAGVVIELLWCLVTNGYIESRSGLVWGPFNLLYGVGAATLSLALYRFRNRGRWLSFLGGMAVGSVVEYACSLFQEAVFGSVSWDYSHLPFNLGGRICLMYSIFWGILGVLWIKDLYPRMAGWILNIPNRAGKALCWLTAVFLAANCAVSFLAVERWSERLEGIPAHSRTDAILDQRFPNERMESIYANMIFD